MNINFIKSNALSILILFLLIINFNICLFAIETNDHTDELVEDEETFLHSQTPVLFQPDYSKWQSFVTSANNNASSNPAAKKEIVKKEKENKDWGRYSFWVTFFSAVFTLFSILVMYLIFRHDNKGAKEEILLLNKQVNNTNTQIKNQKASLQKTSENNLMVLQEMKKSVLEIKDHMVNKDLYLKLIEHKQSIKSSFSFLFKNYLVPHGAMVADGTIMQDKLVNDKVSGILDHISVIDGLLDKKPDAFYVQKLLCEKDLNNLFGKRPIKDDNVANWIKETNEHFTRFDSVLDEMVMSIKNQKSIR